jgi:hypothetical protein
MKTDVPNKTPVIFYRTPVGREVVLDWLKGLAGEERAISGQDLMRVRFRLASWGAALPAVG